MSKRICIFGGPGTGKSTMAARIYYHLKAEHCPYELVDEAIKGMAWQKIPPTGFDQVWLMGKQIHREDVVLRSGGSVITSGPPLQQAMYAQWQHHSCFMLLWQIALKFEEVYPAINILLKRNVPYGTEGRYQSNEEEAAAMDDFTRHGLELYTPGYGEFTPQEFDQILDFVRKNGGFDR